MPRIEITLCSDLCAASGDGFFSVIDTDVCFDEMGIPFIPSRRLKGVLREAAEFIENRHLSEIFGEPGQKTGGSLRLENAFLSDYEAVRSDLAGIHPEKTMTLFTYTRAATAIEENSGSAKEDSLRFVRVVKQYSPKDKKPLLFNAVCEVDSRYYDDMKRICQALRAIGYRRNRGFGAVRCVFEPGGETQKLPIPALEDDVEYKIPLTLVNTSPLILSSSNTDETEDFISGTALSGALAWAHPKKGSLRFDELFLNKDVIFSNLYLGREPVPLCYAKLKRKGGYINLASDEIPDDDTPRPLKAAYLDERACILDAAKDVIYHHSTRIPLLYTQNVLRTGQSFNGSIKGNGRDLREILGLIKNASLRIGKSKTAQYANCQVFLGAPQRIVAKKVTAQNETIAVLLRSDVILLENGVYVYDPQALATALGIGRDYDKEKSSILFRTVTGYSGVWNLKKPHAKAFKRGSVLFFNNVSGEFDQERYLGAKINEGFGHCEIMLLRDLPKIKNSEKILVTEAQNSGYARLIHQAGNNDTLKDKAVNFAKINPLSQAVTSSQIGRVSLMLKQAKDEKDFKDRIEAIKTDSVRSTLSEYLEKARETQSFAYEDYQLYWGTVFRWHKYQLKILTRQSEVRSNE